ncbi:hypothetical protein [Coraliomargarita parva]|uniref:hypothetical protein n=1 Tax=Coraliomargarita parva TaxID=3014050 RepID=UPI0022B3440D|nr:hypothetical protein [Coraliomargarita parva]
MKILAHIIIASLISNCAFACFIEMPIEKVLATGDIIVSGKIERVIPPARSHAEKDEYLFDIGEIRISEVFKNSLNELEVKKGEVIPLKMPSTSNTMRISTDIRYKEGLEGIWILTYHEGGFHAGYQRYQPLEFKKELEQKRGFLAVETRYELLVSPKEPSHFMHRLENVTFPAIRFEQLESEKAFEVVEELLNEWMVYSNEGLHISVSPPEGEFQPVSCNFKEIRAIDLLNFMKIHTNSDLYISDEVIEFKNPR